MQQLYTLTENDRVCKAFAFAAYQTWADLGDLNDIGEESITDYRILQLKRMCPQEITVIKFSKKKEAAAGADWEWWFGCNGEWFGMRVQAKRLDIPRLEYIHLDHTIGKTSVLQVDKLIESAKTNDLYALYCFYNYWNTPTQFPWPCGTFMPKDELWGAAIADAQKVKAKIDNKQKSLADVLPISMPLSCLACCHGNADDLSNSTLPHRARGIALALNRVGATANVPRLVPSLPWYATPNANINLPDPPVSLADLDGILIVEERSPNYDRQEAS